MDSKKKMGVAFFLTAAMLSAGGLALWISGWSITGNMAVSGGSQPANQESVITFSGSTGDIVANSTYSNADGIQNLTFSCSDSHVVSTAGNCQYQGLGKDITAIYVSQDGSNWLDCADTPNVQIHSGANPFYFKAVIDSHSCPLGGYESIQASLV